MLLGAGSRACLKKALEPEIPLSACNLHKALFHNFSYFFVWNILKLGLDHGVAEGAGFGGGVILQVFF